MAFQKKNLPVLQTSLLALSTAFAQNAHATSFTISDANTTARTLTLSETGVIDSGASLTPAPDSIAVTLDSSSSGASFVNNGTISTTNFAGVYDEGSSNIIINSGTISTSGVDVVAFDIRGAGTTLTNNGTISTSGGTSAEGIFANAENITITNNGTISSTGSAIGSIRANVTIINNGIIYSGILSVGPSGETITNSGTIAITDNSVNGIYSYGSGATITNSATISTTGDDSDGINSYGSGATITNSATISTTGDDSNGIYSYGSGTTITNSGTITTTGDSANAIHSTGDDLTMINNGTMSTSDGAEVIYSTGERAIITNNGTLISLLNAGNNAEAIDSNGDYAVITNNGNITSHNSGEGINSSGDYSTIINNGNITITYENNNGIFVNGDDSTVTNNGTITASNHGSAGIVIVANNNTIINNGKIIATGSATQAIFGGTGSQTVTLGKGSEIIGTVNLGDGTDSITVSGNGISGRVLTANVESLNIGSNVAGVVVGNNLHTVDPTGAAMLTTSINKLSLNIHDVINSHNNQDASAVGAKARKTPTWVNIFGSNFDRGADAGNLAYRNQTIGFVGGYKLDSNNSKGLIFGVSSSDLETKETSFKTDVTSFYVGAYKNINLAKATSLKFDLVTGYERYETKRTVVDNINGYQTANSDFGSFFISPSATLEKKFKINKLFELNPMARLAYTSAFFGENRETGTTSTNINTKQRKAHIFNTRIGVNAVLNLRGKKFELGTGFDNRIIKEGKVRSSISETDFRYNTNNDQNVNGHYVRAAANIANIKGFSLAGSFEKRKADGNENEYFFNLGASHKF